MPPFFQEITTPPARIDPGHRPYRFRQVHHPGGHDRLHQRATTIRHILTIEDPIEFVHQSKKCLVNQREVHRDTLGFNEALRSALREDPDMMLVGEMRDLETIRLALTAAETGHLVFGTLHTSSAAKTIDRIIDVFPGRRKRHDPLHAIRIPAGGHFANPAEKDRRRSYCRLGNHGRQPRPSAT